MADGKVVIQVDMDGNKAQSGVERLKSMMGGLAESGERVGSVFKSVLGANIVSGALIAGIQSLGNAMKSVFATALDEGAKLQQSFGGIDTLYKGAEDTMKQYATTAAAAGISANTYAEQAVSFGASLKKALGGDAVKAAESANKAIMAMADNSAKMGTDIGSIQMAYQGFAKGNYTMLDNLKLGYGGTQQEMQRLLKDASKLEKAMGKKFDINNFADIVEAIDLVQQELGVAGVAAEEAKTTFSGSFAAMKASASNFLANLALGEDIGPSLKALVSTTSTFLLGNFLPMVGNIMRQLPQAIETALAEAGPKIEQGFKSLFASLGVDEGVFDSFKDTFRDVIVTAQSLFESFTGEASGFGNVIQGVSNIIETANTMIQNLAMGFQFALEAFENTGAIQNAYQAFKDLSEAALDLAVKLGDAIPWDTIGEAAGKIVNFVSQMASSFASFIKGLDANTIRNVATALLTMAVAFKGIQAGVAIAKGLKSAFDFGKNIVSLIGNVLGLTAAQAANAGASAAMSAGNTAVGSTAGASASSVMQLGVAVLMVGAGILAAAAGVYVLVQAAMQLASAGTGAQIALLAIVAGVALLAVGAAALGPALTVGAVGILAFGAAIALIGAGIVVAALGIAVLVDAIANGFALIVNTISSNAPQIISIIQAIAEGIRTGMDGVANIIISVGMAINIALQGIADIFKSVGEAISTAAQGIGKAIETVFNGISTVITATGDAIRTILDGIANVFESIGNAARNAGLGVKSMAEGIQLLVGLNLIDLASTLTVVSAGLTAIANSGIATAGPGLQQAGTGLMLIATSAQLASLALQSVPTALSSLSTSLGTLPETLTSAGASMSAFASSVTASFASLSGSVSSIMMLQTGLMALANAMMMAQSGASAMSSTLTMINTSASSASASISQLASGIASAMSQAVASVQSSMALIVSVILQSSIQMTQAGQQAGRGVSEGITNGIRSGIGSAMSAMTTMVSSIRATAMSGVSAMRYVGSMIGQGLASGMYSALGAVTAAADALVAQAERAAQAKAKIHSPSRLFRDNVGRYISQGVAVGILADAHKVDDAMGDVFDQIKAFNFAPEDILGVGGASLTKTLQVESDLDRQIKASVKVVQEKSNRLVEQALDVAEKAVKRPVNMMMESGTLVGQIGQQMTDFQNDKLMIDNMMRGII
ncbi:tail tape measure protein [Streptococcus oralis]|uniref:tail tape measure protein n=1 Tax=Streptococcus oralis TaxID=1303 RepID=UPI0020005D97|nr:tail tape measure protein [Streptococcus oralis]